MNIINLRKNPEWADFIKNLDDKILYAEGGIKKNYPQIAKNFTEKSELHKTENLILFSPLSAPNEYVDILSKTLPENVYILFKTKIPFLKEEEFLNFIKKELDLNSIDLNQLPTVLDLENNMYQDDLNCKKFTVSEMIRQTIDCNMELKRVINRINELTDISQYAISTAILYLRNAENFGKYFLNNYRKLMMERSAFVRYQVLTVSNNFEMFERKVNEWLKKSLFHLSYERKMKAIS